MRLLFTYFFLLVVFVYAEEPTIIPKNVADEIDSSLENNKTDAYKEIQSLYQEKEALEKTLQEYQEKNQELLNSLKIFEDKQKIEDFIATKQQHLLNLIEQSIIKNGYYNLDYMDALQAVKREDYQGAMALLKNVDNLSFEDYKNNLELLNKDNNKVIGSKTEEQLQIEYEILKQQANLILGYLYMFKKQFLEANSQFSKVYIVTEHPQLLISSIANAIEIFDVTNKSKEVCVSVAALEATISDIKSQNSSIQIGSNYTALVKLQKEKHQCDQVASDDISQAE